MLALVNPKRRKKTMAAKKRRSTKRRTVRHTATRKVANKTRRHTAKRRTSKRRVYASRRHHNPPARRRRVGRRRHHRNPIGAYGGDILNFTVAGLAQGIVTPLVGGFAGRFLPFGAYNGPIITAGTGWLLSKAFSMFSATRRFEKPALIFGFAAAAMQVLQPIVARTIGGATGMSGWPNGVGSGWNRRPGVRGIAAVTGIPPQIMPPPMPPQNGQTGMNGMAVRNGQWA
jgi:hypothetical protein